MKEKTDDGAGTYGPKTRAMLKALSSGELNKTTNTTVINTTVTTPDTTTTTPTDTATPTTSVEPNQNTTELGDVRNLQTQLKDL